MATRTVASSQVSGLLPPGTLSKPAPIRARLDLIEKIGIGRGWRTPTERARGMGIDPSVYSRVIRQEVAPGAAFISRVCLTYAEWSFEDLFIVVENERTDAA